MREYAEASQERLLLAKLPVAEGAAFDSRHQRHESKCLAETREKLLDEIDRWCKTSGGACIYWLSGMAGTGKSTIARTIAHRLAGEGILGGSFFFSKGQGDVGNAAKFFTTIAALLVENIPSLKPHVCKVIVDDPRILNKNPRDQWEQLILQPLQKLPTDSDSPDARFVLVIDALDECDDDRDAGLILHLFSQIDTISSIQLQVFVTSRPGSHIGFGFRSLPQSTHHCFILHEIPAQIVDNDIRIFLLDETKKIRQEHYMANDWPGNDKIQVLCERAGQLFIFASTACHLMRTRLGPEYGLTRILNDFKGLDQLYIGVLENAMRHYGPEEASYEVELNSQFRRILGCIVILLNAVAVTPLARLCGLEPTPVFLTVDSLRAIFKVPNTPSDPNSIRLHHPSFRDFILDPKRCTDPRLLVDEAEAHGDLFSNCLDLMSKLQKDICNLQLPGIMASAVEKGEVEKSLPPEIQYACRYWAHHLQRSNTTLCNDDKVHNFLRKHFLHWLEALSLIGVLAEGVHAVITLESMLMVWRSLNSAGKANFSQPKSPQNDHLYELVYDAKRFILSNRGVIEVAPLQAYSSALAFCPSKSRIRNLFSEHLPCWIKDLPVVQDDWDPLLQILEGHSGWVRIVVFSPVGKLLASGSDDGTVRLWDLTTGSSLGSLQGHSNWVRAMAFSPDGKHLASGSNDCTIRLWDPATGASLGTLQGHSDCVTVVAFSPDGRHPASGSDDRTVRLWSLTTGSLLGILQGHSGFVGAVAFSPDGKCLVSGSGDRTVRLWDPISGASLGTLQGHSDWVRVVEFLPDGKHLSSGSNDGTVRLWDLTTGSLLGILQGHSGWVRTVAFSPDGKLLASGSDDRTVRLWDPTTGAPLVTLKGHSDWISVVVFSPDGKLLASGSDDRTVRLWNPSFGSSLRTLQGHSSEVRAVAFSPDGKLLASGSDDRTVRLWDPTTGASVKTLKGHSDGATDVAFSPDGKHFASGSGDCTIRLWTLQGRSSLITATFSPDGKHVASGSKDGKVRRWDPTSGTLLETLQGHSKWIRAVAFSPNGKHLASGSDDRTVRLWDLTTGSLLGTLQGHSGSVRALAFSLDGKFLASGSNDRTVRLWDPTTGAPLGTLVGHFDWVRVVVFSPDGKLLASGSNDRTIRVWDPSTGSSLRTLQGHSSHVRAVAFSPDGERLASGSEDRTLRLWDVKGTAVELFAIKRVAKFLSFSRDGRFLETENGNIKLDFVDGNDRRLACSPSLWTGDWVIYGTQRLLWLPVEFRNRCLDRRGDDIAIGTPSGGAMVIRFDLLALPTGKPPDTCEK